DAVGDGLGEQGVGWFGFATGLVKGEVAVVVVQGSGVMPAPIELTTSETRKRVQDGRVAICAEPEAPGRVVGVCRLAQGDEGLLAAIITGEGGMPRGKLCGQFEGPGSATEDQVFALGGRHSHPPERASEYIADHASSAASLSVSSSTAAAAERSGADRSRIRS